MTLYKTSEFRFGQNTYRNEYRYLNGKVLKVQCYCIVSHDMTRVTGEKLEATWDPDDPEVPEYVKYRLAVEEGRL